MLASKAAAYLGALVVPNPPVVANSRRPAVVWNLRPLYDRLFDLRHGSGVDVMAEDWDTLVILDACRYDDFAAGNQLDGRLEHRISPAVDSATYMRESFGGRELHDTVYVTANPHVAKLEADIFHDIVREPLRRWDDEHGCVLPETVTDIALDVHERYPEKRVIVHYMQPHDPPLGRTAERLRDRIELGGVAPSVDAHEGERLLPLVADGTIPADVAREAYRETLSIALDAVERLTETIEGRIVLTADHGEMFGETPYRLFGPLYEHSGNPRTRELCKVPWFVVERGPRRTVTEGSPVEQDTIDEEEIVSQLEDLGYR